MQHKRKNDELASYVKKQKTKYHGVSCVVRYKCINCNGIYFVIGGEATSGAV